MEHLFSSLPSSGLVKFIVVFCLPWLVLCYGDNWQEVTSCWVVIEISIIRCGMLNQLSPVPATNLLHRCFSDWIKLIGCSPLLWMMVINVSWPGIAKIGLKDVSDSCSACTVAIPSCRQYKCTRMLPKVFPSWVPVRFAEIWLALICCER
jgi:hypothetical protein